jgi:hypothetical protein
MRRLSLAFAACLMMSAPAAAFDAKDRTFQRGRVGAIVEGKTKPEDLARLYGAGNLRQEQMDEPGGGQLHPGVFVFHGTADMLEVHLSEDGKTIDYVIVMGKNWVSKEGLRIGLKVADLERLNRGPFAFYGFGFDYGGQVLARGGVLKDYLIFIQPTRDDKAAMQALTKPESELSSRHPAVAKLALEVISIRVEFGQK